MSANSNSSQTPKKPIDVRTLPPNSAPKIANILANGFEHNGTIISNKIPSQHAVNTIINNIPNATSKEILKIDNVSSMDCERLQRYGITLSSINIENNSVLSSLKTAIANIIASRIKKTESVEEKTLDHLKDEGTFYFQDLVIADDAVQTRCEILTNKLIQKMRNKPREEIESVLKLLIIFDLRLYTIDLDKPERKEGIPNESIKIMWKLVNHEDLDRSTLRSKTCVLQHLAKLYAINDTQYMAMHNQNDNNYISYNNYFKDLCKWGSTKGNAFIFYGNAKIKKLINDLYLNGYKSEAKTKKKASTKSSSTNSSSNKKKRKDRNYDDTNNNNDNNNNNNKNNNNNNNDSDQELINYSSNNVKRTKLSHQQPTYGAYSLNDEPRQYSQSYYDTIPVQLTNFEGREVWSIQHQSNCLGFWCHDSLVILIMMGLPAKILTVSCEFDVNQPRCIADINYEPLPLKKDDIAKYVPEEFVAKIQGAMNMFTLPKRSIYSVIFPAPEEFRNSLCKPVIDIKKEYGSISLIFAAQPTKLMHIRNSLNSSLKFKCKNVDNEIQKDLIIITFLQYREQMSVLNMMDDLISSRGEWFYYKKEFENLTLNVPDLNGKDDVINYWSEQYENAAKWKKIRVNQIMEKEEAVKSNPNNKPEILDTFGFDDEVYDQMIKEKKINDKRIEILEKELSVQDCRTINEFDCAACHVNIRGIEWNEMDHLFCNKCGKKTFKRKENVSLYECKEDQLLRDAEIIAHFPKQGVEDEHYDIGKMYVKYTNKAGDHIVAVLFCNANIPTIYKYNDAEFAQSLKNTKLISKW